MVSGRIAIKKLAAALATASKFLIRVYRNIDIIL